MITDKFVEFAEKGGLSFFAVQRGINDNTTSKARPYGAPDPSFPPLFLSTSLRTHLCDGTVTDLIILLPTLTDVTNHEREINQRVVRPGMVFGGSR